MNLYRFLADFVIVGHFAYVAFVIIAQVAILLGGWRKWAWIRNFWFRIVHFLMIAVVAVESIFGIVCPLTRWEDALREKAGETIQEGSFIGRWIDKWLFLDVSNNTMLVVYCGFALLVLLSLVIIPPRWPFKRKIAENGTK